MFRPFLYSIRFFEMDDVSGRKGENIRAAVPFVRQITQDGKPKLEVYRPTTNPIYYYTQVSTFHWKDICISNPTQLRTKSEKTISNKVVVIEKPSINEV